MGRYGMVHSPILPVKEPSKDGRMILIDPLRAYPRCRFPVKTWCHMMTDDPTEDGLEELHSMAEAIGLRRERFQARRGLPHYDLIPCMRGLALLLGAVEVNTLELARRCWRGTCRSSGPNRPSC